MVDEEVSRLNDERRNEVSLPVAHRIAKSHQVGRVAAGSATVLPALPPRVTWIGRRYNLYVVGIFGGRVRRSRVERHGNVDVKFDIFREWTRNDDVVVRHFESEDEVGDGYREESRADDLSTAVPT